VLVTSSLLNSPFPGAALFFPAGVTYYHPITAVCIANYL